VGVVSVVIDADEETASLRAMAYAKWGANWDRVGDYESNPLELDVRCSVSTKRRTGEHMISFAPRIETGEELPGSWFQQANRCVRTWCSVAGEFEAKPSPAKLNVSPQP
jgi:hypothetical protein